MRSGAAGRVLAAYASDDVDSSLVSVRRHGYAVSDEDVTPGIGAVGVPVFSSDGEVRAALSVGGLIADIRAHTADFAEALQSAADQLRLR
ncbi:IclR family transcriptional regulator C-terminal domain-containing protein [Cryobacterium sp. Y11]|uniref:IclR family transcriptional regulator domain-containing protein n=1 Tax=Cryobacterium sp. Y11 TaxID=2045016 RepID=UPI001E3AC15C|nr:IclR family transcriptional regulator C-terminal domain-containing protein [Cryobacterium sp. Y11]